MQNNPLVIGLVGESGSGKDTVAHYLRDKYDATLLRFSDPIKDILRMFFEHPSREDQAWIAVEFKKRFGDDIFARALDRKILFMEGLVSLNGLRYMEDYDYLRKFNRSVLIYVTAHQQLRWKRTVGRGEKADDDISFERFAQMEAALPTEKSIPDIGAKAEYTIRNEGTFEELIESIESVMRQIQETGK